MQTILLGQDLHLKHRSFVRKLSYFIFLKVLLYMTVLMFNLTFRSLIVVFFYSILSSYLLHCLRKKYYTFWTLLISLFVFDNFISLYFFVEKVKTFGEVYGQGIYFALLILNSIIFFVTFLSYFNPLFYPNIGWWEYDFRYKKEAKVEIYPIPIEKKSKKELKDDNFDSRARLFDIRGNAFSLASFEDLELGKPYYLRTQIKSVENNDESYANVAIVCKSRRTQLVGRPYIYGVQLFPRTVEKKEERKTLKFFKSLVQKI